MSPERHNIVSFNNDLLGYLWFEWHEKEATRTNQGCFAFSYAIMFLYERISRAQYTYRVPTNWIK